MAIVGKSQRERESGTGSDSVVEQKEEAVRRQETINWNILSIVVLREPGNCTLGTPTKEEKSRKKWNPLETKASK